MASPTDVAKHLQVNPFFQNYSKAKPYTLANFNNYAETPVYPRGTLLETTCDRSWTLGRGPNVHALTESFKAPAGTIVEVLAYLATSYQYSVWIPQYSRYSITDVDNYKLISRVPK